MRALIDRLGFWLSLVLLTVVASWLSFVAVLVLAAVLPFSLDPALVPLAALVPALVMPLVAVVPLRLYFDLSRGERALQHVAHTDPLTGILNRSAFYPRAEATLTDAIEHRHAVAVIMLDLDHFKAINDTYGHLVGDAILAEVSRRVITHLDPAALFARFGGEEFVILLPDFSADEAFAVADRLRLSFVSYPMQVRGHRLSVTLSAGVHGWSPDHGPTSIDELINLADMALLTAKANGRNTVDMSRPGEHRPRFKRPVRRETPAEPQFFD